MKEIDDKPLEREYFEESLEAYAKNYVISDSSDEDRENKSLYVIYARKSTEDDQRQVQSIEDQIHHCKKYARENSLEVVEIIREEKSAMNAGDRDQFNDMLKRIKKRDFYNSILSWHPDRLSRNMKEAGEILDLLDNGLILDLKFPSYTFNNDAAGKMTLSILFAMAKEFSDKLSDDTKRGIEKKIKEGKYCGSSKRGYYNNKLDYFRPDDRFDLYKEAWEMYLQGDSQNAIREYLNNNGEDLTKSAISKFFQDPFYAGFYCYGEHVVNLKEVDPEFLPQVSAKDFIKIQKLNNERSRGWTKSSEFRPFNNLVICGECGNYMRSAVSTGRTNRYLNITCGNSNCKESRREKGVSPIANSIRGKTVLDYALNLIKHGLDIDEGTYDVAKEKYYSSQSSFIEDRKKKVKSLKKKVTELDKKGNKLSERLLDESNEEVAKKLSNDCDIVLKEKRLSEMDLIKLEKEITKKQTDIKVEFPSYSEFTNLFKDLVVAVENTDNPHLIDQIVKLVFMNLTVNDKKVLRHELNQPFKTYEELENFDWGGRWDLNPQPSVPQTDALTS